MPRGRGHRETPNYLCKNSDVRWHKRNSGVVKRKVARHREALAGGGRQRRGGEPPHPPPTSVGANETATPGRQGQGGEARHLSYRNGAVLVDWHTALCVVRAAATATIISVAREAVANGTRGIVARAP